MPDIVCNIAKGRVAELYNRIDSNDPAGSVLVIVPVNRGATTDETLRDCDTLAAILAVVTERTANGWNRKILTDADLAAMTVDDVNNRMPLAFPQQAWTPTVAGDTVTDLVFSYDAVAGSGADSDIVPLTVAAFAITPDGSEVVANAGDFFRAS
ncbi:MAG: hypothetical protein ACRDUA_17935 [Micromonosporaceae bacterium]